MGEMKKNIDNKDLLFSQYIFEVESAKELINAPYTSRQALYNQIYSDFYKKFPHLVAKKDIIDDRVKLESVKNQYEFLKRFLDKNKIFLEIGAGDCTLVLKVCKFVKQAVASDVSNMIFKKTTPKNFKFVQSNGIKIPLETNSIDLIFCNHVVEHLHPEDVYEQIKIIHDLLSIKGRFVCITPNKWSGPHDVSRRFELIASGLHLKEWTNRELSTMMRTVGFSNVYFYAGGQSVYVKIPAFLIFGIENILKILPLKIAIIIGRTAPIRSLLGIKVCAEK